ADQQDLAGPGAPRPRDFEVGARYAVGVVHLGAHGVALGAPGGLDVVGGGVQRLRPEHVALADGAGELAHVRLDVRRAVALRMCHDAPEPEPARLHRTRRRCRMQAGRSRAGIHQRLACAALAPLAARGQAFHAAGGRLGSPRGSGEKIMAGKLAEELWAARVAGSVVELAPADEPASAAAAYEVQAAMVRIAGLEPVGWKIGATTEATQALLAVDAPFVGPLFAPHCHPNGARV